MSLINAPFSGWDPAVTKELEKYCANPDKRAAWLQCVTYLRQSSLSYEVQEQCHSRIFGEGTHPVWLREMKTRPTHWEELRVERGLSDRDSVFRWSIEQREAFWAHVARKIGIRFDREPGRVLDDTQPNARWFPEAKLNIVRSCFQANPEAAAIVWQKEGGALETISYGELEALTHRIANGLRARGLGPADAIAINMPLNPEAVAAYLAIVRLGGHVVSIADSFAPEEIQTRLRIAGAKAILTADFIQRGGKEIPLYEKVKKASAPRAFVLKNSTSFIPLRPEDHGWEALLGPATPFEAPSCEPTDPINILFSSGTTGDPKAIPWNHLTPLKCAMDGYYHQDIHPGDRVAWPTNLGWMMGPWLIFASLLNRATIALYGGAPSGRDFGEFVEKARVQMLGVVPSMVKSWRSTRCMEGLDWTALQCFSSTGECSNASDYFYLMALAGYRPIIEYCGGTEIGGGYITSSLEHDNIPSTFATPALGIDVRILDEAAHPAQMGELYLVPPSVGLSDRLLNRDHDEVYYRDTPLEKGRPLRRHGDEFERLPNGYFRGHGRVDDTMNLGGIKVSSSEIERVLAEDPDVMESAAIAVSPPGGGPSQLVLYLVPRQKHVPEDWKGVLQKQIREKLNPLFKIHDIVCVESLPRTASNKVMRRVLRSRYQER